MTTAVHPLTQERLNANAEAWRRIAAYAEAHRLHQKGEVTDFYVARKHEEAKQATQRLIEAAQAEGADAPELTDDQVYSLVELAQDDRDQDVHIVRMRAALAAMGAAR